MPQREAAGPVRRREQRRKKGPNGGEAPGPGAAVATGTCVGRDRDAGVCGVGDSAGAGVARVACGSVPGRTRGARGATREAGGPQAAAGYTHTACRGRRGGGALVPAFLPACLPARARAADRRQGLLLHAALPSAPQPPPHPSRPPLRCRSRHCGLGRRRWWWRDHVLTCSRDPAAESLGGIRRGGRRRVPRVDGPGDAVGGGGSGRRRLCVAGSGRGRTGGACVLRQTDIRVKGRDGRRE